MLDLHREWIEDAIELHVLKDENKLVSIEDLEYRDVFPKDSDATPDSMDAILERLMQERPEADLDELLAEAKKRANRKK